MKYNVYLCSKYNCVICSIYVLSISNTISIGEVILKCGTVMVGCRFMRKFCGVRVNQTSPGLRGIERPILSTTETVWSS